MIKGLLKDTKPGGQVFALLVISVVAFILYTGVTIVLTLCNVDVGNVENLLAIQAVGQIISMLAPALLFAYLVSDSSKTYLKVGVGGVNLINLLLVLAIVITYVPLQEWLTQINDACHFPSRFASVEKILRSQAEQSRELIDAFLSVGGMKGLAVNLLVMALVPAVCEEFLFRGALQQVLVKWFRKPHLAVFVTAVIFSLGHGDVFAFLPRFFIGLVLGYVFMYCGSIWLNVGIHFANNAMIVILSYMNTFNLIGYDAVNDTLSLPWYVTVVATCLFAFSFWLIVSRTSRNACEAKDESGSGIDI